MEIQVREEQAASVVAISGRLDTTTAAEFQERLEETVKAGKKILILNMGELQYISSAGLRVVLQIAKELKAEQGDVYLACLKNPAKEIFSMSGFLTIFKSFETEADALEQAG